MSGADVAESFSRDVLDRISPFHFVFGPDLTIQATGPALRRCCPAVRPGQAVGTAFEIGLLAEGLSFERLGRARRTLVTLRYRETNLTLKGEFMVDQANGVAVFSGVPLIARPEDLRAHGLVLADFTVSDTTLDYLMLSQTKDIMIRDISRLADDLERSQRELADLNVRLEERVLDQERLLAVSEVLGGVTDLTEGLRRVCREMALLMSADCAVAWILDPERSVVTARTGYHIPPGLRQVVSIGIAELPFRESVLERGELASSSDASEDPRMRFDLFRSMPHQSCVIVPIPAEGAVLGAFQIVWWNARRSVSPKEEQLLLAIGRQSGLLIRSARLVEALAKRAERLALLTDLHVLVSSSLDLDRVIGGVVESAAKLMGVDNSKFWLASAGGGHADIACVFEAGLRDRCS